LAWVHSIQVEALAGRTDSIKLVFNRDVNILWGVNGCGKTSLLKILHAALQDDAAQLVRVPFTSATVEIRDTNEKAYVRTITKRANIQGTLAESESDTPEELFDVSELAHQSQLLRWSTKPKTARSGTAFAHRYLPISRVSTDRRGAYRGVYQERPEVLDEAVLDKVFARDLQLLWRDYSARESMRINEIQRRGIAAILQTVIEHPSGSPVEVQIDPEEARRAVQTFLTSQSVKIQANIYENFAASYKDNLTLQQVTAQIVEIQDSIKSAEEPRQRIEKLAQDIFSGNKSISFASRSISVYSGTKEIPIESLSSGEKQMVRILIECLAASGNSIIIDEPELSMHVDWQNKLIASMQLVNDAAQIITATHSPEVMANLPDQKIYELTLDD
jgi:predicted ATPase